MIGGIRLLKTDLIPDKRVAKTGLLQEIQYDAFPVLPTASPWFVGGIKPFVTIAN